MRVRACLGEMIFEQYFQIFTKYLFYNLQYIIKYIHQALHLHFGHMLLTVRILVNLTLFFLSSGRRNRFEDGRTLAISLGLRIGLN